MSMHGGPLVADEAACLVENSIEVAIIGSGPGNYGKWTEQQATAAHAAGMKVEGYTFLEWGYVADIWVRSAIRSFGAMRPSRLWIDVEDTSIRPPLDWEAYVQTALDEVRAHGIETGIYTGGWYWRGHLGNSTAFAHEKLWNSYYDGDPDIDGLPYGGWTTAAIEQYQGTTELCGQSVDLNAIWEEDDMGLVEEIARIKKLLVDTGVEQAGAEGIDLLLSIRNDQAAMMEHLENHALAGATYNVTGTLTLEEQK
jgi:hypothetical protein